MDTYCSYGCIFWAYIPTGNGARGEQELPPITLYTSFLTRKWRLV